SAREEGLENTGIPDSPENVTVTEKEKDTETPVTGDASDDDTIVLSQSDESLKTVSENVEKDVSAEKNKVTDKNVIDVDNLNSGESPAEKT
ncbi:hypothetical protein A2U01_0078005, partial [Trifolium medium]|nr:hypothetical protein [Trifolium medium]